MRPPLPIHFLPGSATRLPSYAIARDEAKSSTWPRAARQLRAIIPGLAGALFCLSAAAFALGQIAGPVPAPAPSSTPRTIPTSRLYYHFLMAVLRNDRLAAQREQQGRNAGALRNLYQRGLGFSDGEFAPIRATAQRLEAELKELDAQARTLTAADHEAHPLQPETSSALQAASEQHQAEFESEVAKLRRALGPSAADRLDIYIQTHIDPTLRTHLPQPSSPPDPNWQKVMLEKYSRFLEMVYRNEQSAARLERQGQGGARLYNSLQNSLGFNDAEFALIRATAQRVAAEENALSAKERAIRYADPAMQTHPPELQALAQKRESTIANEISELQHALGSKLSARLGEYIHAHYPTEAERADLPPAPANP